MCYYNERIWSAKQKKRNSLYSWSIIIIQWISENYLPIIKLILVCKTMKHVRFKCIFHISDLGKKYKSEWMQCFICRNNVKHP